MSEYYVVIPKNAKNKGKFLARQFFNQQLVTASMFGQKIQENHSLIFYKNKPLIKPTDFNKHFLIKISIDHDPDVLSLKGLSSEALHGGNIRLNLDAEDKDVKSGLEDEILVRVEAQIMPNGQEMRLSDIEAAKHTSVDKNNGPKKKPKVLHKSVIKAKPITKKTKVLHKTMAKKKVSVKKPKVLRKAVIKAKSHVKKAMPLHKMTSKNKAVVKKTKVLHKAIGKNNLSVNKSKVLHKTASKNKGSVKKPKVLQKTAKHSMKSKNKHKALSRAVSKNKGRKKKT